MELLHENISNLILKSFYGSKNQLPIELDISFFKNALEIEMKEERLEVEQNRTFEIHYKQQVIGNLRIDFVINNCIAINVVSTTLDITEQEITNMRNCLRLTYLEVGLILNFGADGQHKRILLTNNYKK